MGAGFIVKPATMLYLLKEAAVIASFLEENRGVWEPRQKAYKAKKAAEAALRKSS